MRLSCNTRVRVPAAAQVNLHVSVYGARHAERDDLVNDRATGHSPRSVSSIRHQVDVINRTVFKGFGIYRFNVRSGKYSVRNNRLDQRIFIIII